MECKKVNEIYGYCAVEILITVLEISQCFNLNLFFPKQLKRFHLGGIIPER